MNRGTIIHSMLLGGDAKIEILPYAEYRTKEARAARDEALACGRIPIKESEYDSLAADCTSVREQLQRHDMHLDGAREACAFWRMRAGDRGILCRSRFDHVEEKDGLIYVDDLKTTSDTHPSAIMRAIINQGYDIQQQFYIKAIHSIRPDMTGRVKFRFWFIGFDPCVVVPVTLDAQFAKLGDLKIEIAVAKWIDGIENSHWPSAGDKPIVVSPPKWEMYKWLDDENRPRNEEYPF